MSDPIAPTLEAARQRLAAVRPAAYARTRNAIDGAVLVLKILGRANVNKGAVAPRDVTGRAQNGL